MAKLGCMYLATSVPPKCPLEVTIWAGGSLALDKRGVGGHHIFQKSRKKGRCTMLERLWGRVDTGEG